MRVDHQLGLLLWKNYIVRKRQPGILALILLWPVAVFMILYTVRDNVDPEYNPTCHFPARMMPQDGLLPFVQSFVCSVGNPCDPLSEYEEVPSFKNATLGSLVVDMQPMLSNDTILSAVKTLPKSIQLLKSMAQILTRPEIKALFDRGIRLGDLFSNHDRIKGFLRAAMPSARPELVDGLFESSIRLYYLIDTFGSSNVDGVICSPESLKKYLILPKDEDYIDVSKLLCEIDSKNIPDILEQLSKHLDFSGLLGMVDRAMAKFRNYDFFQDLRRAFETIINLKTSIKYVPEYLRLREWMPKIIMAFKNVTFKEIDVTFINKSIDILDPIFQSERDWSIARHGLLKMNSLLEMVKASVLSSDAVDSFDDFFTVIDHLKGTIKEISSEDQRNITRILDVAYMVLQDGVGLTKRLLNRHADKLFLAAEVFDGLKYFFSDNVMNSLTYIVSLTENIVKISHHVAMLHEQTPRKIYEIMERHPKLVQDILKTLDPMVYRRIVRSFSRLPFLERFTDNLEATKVDELLCQKETLDEIFDNFTQMEAQRDNVTSLLCSDSGKLFIADVYQSFRFESFSHILENTLSTLVGMALGYPISIDRANLTSVVKATREFVSYLESPTLKYPNWNVFKIDEKWAKAFEETRAQGRLDILAIHLTVAKSVGSRSLSYSTIKPDLETMGVLADMILRDLHSHPTDWIGDVRRYEFQLIEAFYLTITDREKTLKILEYSNFTKSYCTDQNPPRLLNFPQNSNETHLKGLICHLAKFVQTALDRNVTTIRDIQMEYKSEHFNWTAFNEKTIEIYKYIDALLYQEEQEYDLERLERLKSDFKISWSEVATMKNTWEISVGLLCKLFNVMESPLFQIQNKRAWTNLYAIAWASSVVFDNMEQVLDQIEKDGHVAKLSEILHNLPQTQILLDVFLRNLSPIILDGIDLISMKLPVHLITAINEYKLRERDWPCVKHESIGFALELRNGSRSFVRELERIACNPGLFIKEWTEEPTLMKVKKIILHDGSEKLLPFKWTSGYTKFRRVVKKFDTLINDANEIVLEEDPKLAVYLKALTNEVDNMFEQRLPHMKSDARGIMDYVDLEIDKVVKVLKSNLTASSVWDVKVNQTDRLLITAKFVSHVFHEVSETITDILQEGSRQINLLTLLGFNGKSVVSIVYKQLPYIISTILNGLSNPLIENKLVNALENGISLSCTELFEWWSDLRIGMSLEEYGILKNFTCDYDPENFNSYVDFYTNELTIYRKPANSYRSYMVTVLGDMYDLGKLIRRTVMSNMTIEQPFSKAYFESVFINLRDSLEAKQDETKDLQIHADWTGYRLLMEGISEALLHVADALKDVETKDGQLYTWQLVKNGDVRQLLKILELHPEETIALLASLSIVNHTNNHVTDFQEIRKRLCAFHFNLDYWKQPDRLRFLMEVCHFDFYQLVRTITSNEFHDAITGRTQVMQKSTPIVMSVTTLLDVVSNLTSTRSGIVFKSNIFNATTWKNLSNETWSVVRQAEGSWAIEMLRSYEEFPSAMDEENMHAYSSVKLIRILQLLDSFIDISSGGDIWQKLRTIYENSRVKSILTLVEDIPNLIITTVETFLTSERLSDFVQKLFLGQLSPCDVDRYLIPPSFVRKKGLLYSITNFCQKIINGGKFLQAIDFLPVDVKSEESYIFRNVTVGGYHSKNEIFWNETYFSDKITHLHTTLFRVISEGYKHPKVPAWWTSFEEGTFKDFSSHYQSMNLRTLAHTVVNKLASLLTDIFKTTHEEDCDWCGTFMIEILNTQLIRRDLYAKLLCDLNHLNISEIHDILIRDFYWNKTGSMIKDYKYLHKKKTLTEYIAAVEALFHNVADIIVDFQNETYSNRIAGCFKTFVGDPPYTRAGLYITFFNAILDVLQRNVEIMDTATTHENINNLTRLTEKYVPIWRNLREVVKQSDMEAVDRLLPNATINVNAILNDRNNSLCRTSAECRNATILYDFLSSKRSGKVLRYDPKSSMYPSIRDIADQLAQSLNLDLIIRQKTSWQIEANWNLTWLKEIIRHLISVFSESANLIDVASKIDFQDVSNVLGVPDVADGVINILKDKTVDKIFASMKQLLEDVEPILMDQEVFDDLNSMINALESMEIFKNLGLLDLKYTIRDMFDNWDIVRTYLVDKIGFSNDVALLLSQSKIDMLSIFMRERNAISLKDKICSPSKLGDMLSVDQAHVTIEEISTALCMLNDSQMQNVTITLIKNLNFDYIFKTLMSANVKNILLNANLTEAEGKIVLDNLSVGSELLPFFKDKLTATLSSASDKDDNVNTEDEMETLSSSQFLKDSTAMLCGKTLINDNGKFYKMISTIRDNSNQYDKKELDSLPTEFCRETYKSVLGMPGGKIVWSYVKPLLRGQILYTPRTAVIDEIMKLANESFLQMEHFSDLMNSFEETLASLASLSEMGDNLKELQDVMSSKVIKIAIKSLGGGNFDGDFSQLDLSQIAWRLKKSKKLINMVGMLNDLMGCVLVDRMKGFSSEMELEAYASTLTDTNEFLAAIVFLDDETGRSKRSSDQQLSDNVVYKIRMDVDYVPSTRRLKNQFWIPGPESSFIEDLRYIRGFIQLQDAIDRSIIKVKAKGTWSSKQNWKTLTQQMPYPCWKHVPFQTTLYESQGLQVCFFFALMLCVGSAVRHIVWERESRNSMVMSVMGLKPWRNTCAWFITSFIELLIVVFSICLILLVGKILPRSDPLLVVILLVDYVFSIVTFCYMISTMFSSASLAAVTTVVMFLLTYMPYIVVIAMEASMSLVYKLFICLSMSTSFCYGCLYAVRKEVQGTGLTWSQMWQESSPGDPMSLGMVLLMIALDGCIYATIGYIVTRYTNSGKGFHGLRSRSLWWADTRSLYGRPSYLAFVNNLYFTNDVLHPSSTYQEDDSDVSSLTVTEKQIGVRFEGVRKVYNGDAGEMVAVDDFTLKLCEGEVTSLLGRNGAGKTTIIKMLTGMLAPTCGEIYLNGEEGCKPDIGVCPQDNVLISTLTPREHMVFYAKLKGRKGNFDMQKNVNDMLASLELGRQEHEPVYRLSGGTKRRLCVALAFLGSPKLVILDEPGAGVDPAARRRIWRLIDQHRAGRIVLLSTHHLDEADMLSDTVVVMHRGRILCTGSPLTLKTTYGEGYKLHVTFPSGTSEESQTDTLDNKKSEALRSIVQDIIPNATMSEESNHEVAIVLPFHGKHGTGNDIAQTAKALEDNQKLLGISHFSLECDTLERVFLDLCARADGGGAVSNSASLDSVTRVDHIGLSMPNEDIDLIDSELAPNPSPLRQGKALLKKRLWHFAKDWWSPLAALVLPTMLVAVAMGFSLIRPPSEDEPPLAVNPKLYNTHPTYFYSIDNSNDPFLQHVSLQLHDRFGDDYAGAWQTLPNDTGTCECLDGQQTCHGVSQAVEGLLQTLPGRPTLDWIVSTHQEYIEKRYGGWSLSHWKDDPLFVVWYNNKGHHSLPSYLNALNSAILRAFGIQGYITTLNHPLKLSSDQLNRTTLLQHVADVGIALVLLTAFSLVGAQGARELVRERLSEEKRILYLAGVHPVTYWTAALIWDFLVFGCSICLAVIVFEIFGLSTYVARDNLPGVCLLLFLFAWAVIPFTHLAEKAFDDSTLSNMVLFCVNTFIGVASLATILVIDVLGKTKAAADARDVLHRILMVFPQYVLGDALVELSKNDITAELLRKFRMDTYKSPLGWDLLGLHYVFLLVVGSLFFLANLAIECRVLPALRKQRISYEALQEDEDVARERMRVESGIGEDDIIKTIKLRKEFRSVYGTNVAVQNLSFGVQSGKCFGLLGVNGAGKSTTFKMLTTEMIPTAGKIVLKGSDVGSGPLCNGEVGYCPQTDAMDGFLSPHQCLTIHGEVCGLNDVPKAVESTLKRFDLLKYAHQRVDSLSGGNKRKLCTAISVMAPVSIVLMDEPTSGMDPGTKGLVTSAVRRVTKNHSSVILTSHSVAECESLCNRVGILAKAGLKCIGTSQHLKHKFGEGYVAFLRFGQPVSAVDLRKAISNHLPQAVISSRQATAARLLVPKSQDMALSTSFAKVKLLADELKATDYTLTQSSLDQDAGLRKLVRPREAQVRAIIRLHCALRYGWTETEQAVLVNFSEELEDETIDSSRAAYSNLYSSMDTIYMDTF